MPATNAPISDRPLRVLHYCAGNLFGGVERLLLTLWEHRSTCPAMQPLFAVSFEGELSRRLRGLGAPVFNVDAARFSRPWTVWLARRRIAKVIAENAVDVAISHGCWAHAVMKQAAKTTVMYLHDAIDGGHWLEKKAIGISAALAIANSEYTKSKLPTGSFGNAPLCTLHCPSPLPVGQAAFAAETRKVFGTAMDAVVVVMVSRWEPYKGHELLVNALPLITADNNWIVWIVGGTQRPHEELFREKIVSLAQQLEVSDRIRLLGQRNDVADILAAADIHCQPNLRAEPFGLTFVEGLAAGLTVITTRLGGGEEILSPDFGMLTIPGDAADLAKALTQAIESPALRKSFAALGPSRARELCDPAKQVPLLYEMLSQAVGRSVRS